MKQTREAWNSYVDYLRSVFDAQTILNDFGADLELLDRGARGKKKKRNPLVVRGFELGKKQLVLTFDDGPRGKHTAKILDILKARDLKAIFCQVGNRVGRQTKSGIKTRSRAMALTKRIIAEGHLLEITPILTRTCPSSISMRSRTRSTLLGPFSRKRLG